MSPSTEILGWDVGGAHLKAARLDGGGRVIGAWQEPCALWRGLDQLDAAMARMAGHLGIAPGDFAGRHGVTMTGEMADLFASRAEGVATLAQAMARHLTPAPVWFFAGAGGWVEADQTDAAAPRIASANWYATARLLAGKVDAGLLIDMGSTTTDIIPIRNGQVATPSVGDRDRLAAGELVYTGVVRSPVMALAGQAPVAGQWLPLMAEHFATSADVYRVLGWLPEAADQHDAADGGAKTVEASRLRLARMVGLDLRELPTAAWTELAAWLAQAQLQQVERGIRQVLSKALLPPDAPLVMAGAGSFLGPRLAARLDRPLLHFHQLLPEAAAEHGWYAPAVAVAQLLAADLP